MVHECFKGVVIGMGCGLGVISAYYGCKALSNWWKRRREIREYFEREELARRRGPEGGIICDPPPRSPSLDASRDQEEATNSQPRPEGDAQNGQAGGQK